MQQIVGRVKAISMRDAPFSVSRFSENSNGRLVLLIEGGPKSPFLSLTGLEIPRKYITVIPQNKLLANIFKDIGAEVAAARSKYPSNQFMIAALMEEVGEASQAMIDHSFGKDSKSHIYLELVQVAAVAIRLMLEGSQEFKFKGIHDNSRYGSGGLTSSIAITRTPNEDCKV